MDASGPIPFRAAVAYGTPRPSITRNAADVRSTTPQPGVGAGGPSASATPVDQVSLATTPASIDALVAGSVRSDINRGVGFDGDPPASSTGPMGQPLQAPRLQDAPLQLYNRHADRLEAATSVAVGRTLDIQA